MRRASIVWIALSLTGCGSASPRGPAEPTSTAPERHGEVRPARSPSTRDLPIDATFGDLIAAARTQDDRRDQDTLSGCLLRAGVDGFRLEADLAVAARPLPPAIVDLDTRLAESRERISLLTRSGTYGEGPLTLVAATTTRPTNQGRALALLLTDRGLYARSSADEAGEREASRIDWLLPRIDFQNADVIAISAEAGVSLRDFASLLGALPDSVAGKLTLAVVLEGNARLPARASADSASRAEWCADGLPELPEDAAWGEFSVERSRARLAEFATRAEACVGASTGRGAGGARVSISMRIDPSGRVSEACIAEDSSADDGLESCLLRSIRQLTFDPMSGYADLALPLRLEPGPAHRQLPLCQSSQ